MYDEARLGNELGDGENSGSMENWKKFLGYQVQGELICFSADGAERL